MDQLAFFTNFIFTLKVAEHFYWSFITAFVLVSRNGATMLWPVKSDTKSDFWDLGDTALLHNIVDFLIFYKLLPHQVPFS